MISRSRPQAASIRETARLAGVSVATVSHVISGKKDRFSAETESKVLAAVRQLGYRPNKIARSLALKKTHTIGFATQREYGLLTRNPYFTSVLDGVMSAAVERRYSVKILAVSESDNPGDVFEDGSLDAVAIVAPGQQSAMLKWTSTASIPTIVVGVTPADEKVSCISVDDFKAAFDATTEVLNRGHRRLGLICDSGVQFSGTERTRGFHAALKAANLQADPQWCFNGNYSEETGRAGVEQILRGNPKPTALFCGSDFIALGALKALREKNVAVPGDVSLFGFDDLELVRHTAPPLSSVHQPLEEIGTRAANYLIEQSESDTPSTARIVVDASLIVRESIANI